MEVGNELSLLRLEHFLRPPLGFGGVFIAAQHSLGLLQIGLTARELGGKPLFVRDRLFHLLLRGRVRLQKRFLASALGAGAHHVCLDSLDAGLGGGNLCFCLIDSGERAFDPSILKLALAAIVLDGGFCGLDCGARLSHLSSIIVVFKLSDKIALLYSLIIGHLDIPNDARHLGAEWSYISADVSVVRDLFNAPALPGVPVPTDRGHDRSRKQHDQSGHHESLPLRPGLRWFWNLLRFRPFDGGRRARCGHHRYSFSEGLVAHTCSIRCGGAMARSSASTIVFTPGLRDGVTRTSIAVVDGGSSDSM